jgi:Reverse transcriptase (RNA-dependent DNA polymerase)
MVYDIKHDSRHRGRLVAGGHLTPVPDNSVYSGVISLKALRIMIFLAKLNKLQLWGADVSSAYLEAQTQEKVFLLPERGLENYWDIH